MATEQKKPIRFKNLGKRDMQHLRDMETPTLRQFKVMAESHRKMRQETNIEPCHVCKQIARKLGLEV